MIDLSLVWQKSFNERRYRIGLHVLFWFGFYMIIGGVALYNSLPVGKNVGMLVKYQLFLFLTVVILFFCYLICVTLYKRLVGKRGIFWRFIGLLVWLLVFVHLYYFLKLLQYCILSYLNLEITPYLKGIASKGYGDVMGSPGYLAAFVFWFFLIMFIPLGSKYFRDQLRVQKQREELQAQNKQLEMAFLKAQIHPHFLFNTLNNIYALITHKASEKSAEMIAGLSSLLRYALYDGKTEFILLGKEVSMLKDFIGLESVRSEDTHLEVRFPTDIPAIEVPPFLLLPLVENAFKHGVNSQLKRSFVKIEMDITAAELHLSVQNNFDADYRGKNSGGLGLKNLKKRLDYYYSKQYHLEIIEKENIFTTSLKLPLLCPQLNA